MSTYDPNDDLLKWAEGLGKTPSPPVSKGNGNKRAEALRRAAERLGVDPVDLGAVISFETGGTFDPHKVGGEGNKYRGLIQFGPDEQRRYYNSKDTFETQLENGVVPFLRDRFKAAGRSTKGAKLEDLYTTIIAGNPTANRNAKDAFGTSARSGTRRIMQEHRPKVLRDIFGGQVPSADTNVTFDFNSALKEADELLSGTQPVANPPFDFNTALSEADQLLGGNQPATQLPPTNPVPTFLRSPNAPMPETITTIEKQATSALDANSPRAAVLLTDPSQIRLLTPSLTRTLKQVSTPDGILLVNEAKARQLGATDYVRDMAKLIGKVDDVGRDTGSGPTVVTLDRDGNELASSRVTSLLSAKMQAEIDKASFPDSAKQQIVDAQDVVAKREDDLKKQIQTLGGLTPEPFADATEPPFAPPPLPGPAVPEPTMEQLPWEGDLNAEYAAYVKYAQQNKLPVMSKQQFIVDVVGKAGQGEAQATDYQTQPNVPQQAAPTQAQRQTRPGETASISRQRQVGQPTSDLNRSVIEYTAPKSITTEEDALRQALRATGELTPNEINRFIANRKRDGIKLLAQPLSVSRTIQVPYHVIAEAKGDASRVEGDIAMEQAQTPVGTEVSQKKYGRLPETQAEQAIDKRIREKDYVVFQKLTEALQAPWMLMSPTAGVKFASDPSDEWLQAEKKRLKEQYGSYANAYDAEQYYQNTTGLEKTVRTFNQGARAFLKNLVGGTAKTAVFLSQLQEDYDPINQLLPDNAKIGLRNAGNIADFISRLVTSGSASTAYKEMDWVKSLDGIDRQQFFKAIQEFDKAVGDEPVLKGRFLGSLGDAGGSAASFIALGAMMPSLVTTNFWGTTRNWGQAVSGVAQMVGSGYEEGKRSDLDEATARKYGLIQGALGVTEMLGAGAELAQFLKSPGLRRQMAQALVEVGSATAREMKQEFAQEVFQTTAGKAVMEYLKDNDESTWRKLYNAVNRLPKQLSESIANEGIIAMITGGVMGGGGRALQLATQSADTTVDARPVNEIPASDGSTTVVTSSQQPQIFTDKQGRRFEVIEDLGDKVRVRNERGGEQIRNKRGLTEVNEKTPEVSKPTAQVDAEPLVQDQADKGEAATSLTTVSPFDSPEKRAEMAWRRELAKAEEDPDYEPDQSLNPANNKQKMTRAWADALANPAKPQIASGETVAKQPTQARPSKQIRYREDMPSGLVDEAPLQSETLEGAKNRLKEVETELQEERRKGTTDAKMGISNERAWQAAVDRIEADPNQEVVSLDINRMKEANDTTSHTGIDKNVLAPIGAAVRKVLKANGIDERNAFRTGGDEVVVAVPKGKAQKIRDEIEKEVGVIEIVAEKDFTNDRTGESFKKGDRIPITISGEIGLTVAEAEKGLGARKRASKDANPVRRVDEKPVKGASGVLNKAFDILQNKGMVEDESGNVSLKMATGEEQTETDSVNSLPVQPRSEFKVKPPKRLYRGIMKSGEGAKTASLGRGLYSTRDKAWLKRNFKFDDVITLTPEEAYPRNPLVIREPSAFADWLLEESGFDNMREFGKTYPDPAEFVRSKGFDGVDAGQEVVRYFDPNEDSILKMTADDSSLERFKDYAYAHTQTVLEDATSEIKEVDGQTVLELNEAGAELARRVEASATGKKVSQFYGSTHTTGQLKKLAQTAKEWADRYEEKGYTADQVKSMRDLAANLETLAEKGGAGVVYIFDFALPHETHHKLVLDALGGKAFPKQAIAELEALDIWNANPTITTPDGQTKSFNSAYPSLSKQHKVFEMAAMLETGEISHSDKDRFLDIFARGILEVTTELDPVQFARILSFRRQPNVLRLSAPAPLFSGGDIEFPSHGINNMRGALKFLRDIAATETFKKHGLRRFNIATNRSVVSSVIRSIQDLKIRDAVVQFIPVDVVDNLVSVEPAANVLLHDPSVFESLLTIDLNGAITIRSDVAAILVKGIAGAGTKGGLRLDQISSLAEEFNTAIGADTLNRGASRAMGAPMEAIPSTIDSSRSGGERDVASGADQTQHIRSIPQDYADITTSDTQRDRTEQTDQNRTNALMGLLQRKAKEMGKELTIREPANGLVDEPPMTPDRKPKKDSE